MGLKLRPERDSLDSQQDYAVGGRADTASAINQRVLKRVPDGFGDGVPPPRWAGAGN